MKNVFFIIAVLTMSVVSVSGQKTSHKITAEVKEINTYNITSTKDTTFSFSNYELGKEPFDWSSHLTNKIEFGKWKIIDDGGNKVLAQTSKKMQDYHFNIIINKKLNFKNLTISVRFKGVEGSEDRGGGPVWRYQDANNYYIVRANPLENNFCLYKVLNGSRRLLKSAKININSKKWYSIKVTMKGKEIKCYFNKKLKIDISDNTFLKAGKVGLWTKSDAVTFFDDLQIKNIK